MAFVNLSLLLGGALVAIPIVLHLIMRQKPKQLIFPALRFIQQRRIANQRRLQLRLWILLALRCALIGVLALALARPSVASAALSNWTAIAIVGIVFLGLGFVTVAAAVQKVPKLLTLGLTIATAVLGLILLGATVKTMVHGSLVMGDQEAPVAAVLVIDTAPRMQYRHENKTRLKAAQETADWLLKQLPADSEVAVIDSRAGSGAFAVDRAAAAKAIERLRTSGTPRPMPEVLTSAVNLVRQNPRQRKEVYVLTDLARAAWTSPASEDLAKQLSDNRNVLLYLIDVGVAEPRNFALSDLRLPADVLPASSELLIETDVRAVGKAGKCTVALEIEQPDPTLPIIRNGKPVLPKSVRRGSQEVNLEAGSSETVRFQVRGLEPGVHQGVVRLLGEDGLALDDVRYFAVQVQEAWPVLVVTGDGARPSYFVDAIAPREWRETGQAQFAPTTIPQPRLATEELEGYRAVVLLDPQPLTPEAWTRLADFADGGGGIAFFLGNNAQPVASFQDAAAIRTLGGKLTRQTRGSGDLYISPRSFDHPITAAFRTGEASVPWDRFPISLHWNLDELSSDARVIIPYGNNKPALVENRLGRGRVLTLTTPVSDPPRPKGHPVWNRLATGEEAWPYVMLVNEMMLYLVRSGETRLNLHTGETAVLANDDPRFPDRYQLFTPLDQPQDVHARDGRLTVRFTDNPGSYRLRGQKDGPLVRGFAVNLRGETSDLTRLPPSELEQMLGKDRFKLAKSRDEIDRAVGNDRVGSEFYPLLMALMALVLGLEQTLSNRFYKPEK